MVMFTSSTLCHSLWTQQQCLLTGAAVSHRCCQDAPHFSIHTDSDGVASEVKSMSEPLGQLSSTAPFTFCVLVIFSLFLVFYTFASDIKCNPGIFTSNCLFCLLVHFYDSPSTVPTQLEHDNVFVCLQHWP